MSLFGWVTFFFIVGIINGIIAATGIKKYLATKPQIENPKAFERFKKMVRQQMFQALAQIGILGPMLIMGLYGLITIQFSGMQILLWLVYNGVIFGVGKWAKKFEDSARSLWTADEELKKSYEDVCQSWKRKALPDF